MIVYSALLLAGLVLSAPWWLLRMLLSGRYREGLAQRLGQVPSAIRLAVQDRPVIWVHAVSVGEVLAAERLITDLQAARPEYVLAISTTTATGQQIARERFPANPVFFFPLDFAFPVRAWLRVLQPRLLVLVEGELWPRLLSECSHTRVPVVVVNARVSDRSFRRTLRVRWLWRRMAVHVTRFLPQSEESAERLQALGVAPDRIATAGNLKFDLAPARRSDLTECIRERLAPGTELVICGSTLEGEEAQLLEVWPQVLALRPRAQLLIAPRHPARFDAVARLIVAHSASVLCMTEWMCNPRPIPPASVLLLDTLGFLSALYELAAVAFVGGSLVPRGGHNPLEPARFGVPVLVGPSYENFREIVQQMVAADAVRIVTPDSLAQDLSAALSGGKAMGERGRLFFNSQAGATERTLAVLLEVLR